MLIFAYACEPDGGSEPGAGWGVVRTLARHADCVVLVGPEHEAGIQRWEAAGGDPAIMFVIVPDVPWPPPSRRGPLTRFLTYLVWLRRARTVAVALHAQRPFALTQHVTYSTYWLPTPSTDLGIPCVWGPVGGAVTTPPSLRPLLGWWGAVGDLFGRAAVRVCAALPATRSVWASAQAVLVQNEATLAALPRNVRDRAVVLNHALFTAIIPATSRKRERYVLFAGALERRKGAELALRALAHTPDDVRLVVAGDGPDRRHLERLAAALGVARRVEFLGRVPRARVSSLLGSAAATLFTGVREEGGLALAEALVLGVPVVVLAHGGARTVAQAATSPEWVAQVEPTDIASTARRLGEALTCFSQSPRAGTTPLIDQEAARRALWAVVLTALRQVER